ncbi:hypothetical protein N9998_00405 [Nitrosopumilus sp.]|nr:hypothetical protein [Nitrosopumilus sp.]
MTEKEVTIDDIKIRIEHDLKMYKIESVNWHKKMLNRSDTAIHLGLSEKEIGTPRDVAKTAITSAEFTARYEILKSLHDEFFKETDV